MKSEISYALMLVLVGLVPATIQAQNFSTTGNQVRNAVVAQVDNKDVLYLSELDGAVSAYTLSGKELWRHISDESAVMFEILAADITGNGSDELLAASANGHVYCWQANGKLLWKFAPDHKVRFSEIAVVGQGKTAKIFAGGNDYQLYEISSSGKLMSQTQVDGVFRKLEAGNFLEKDQTSLFIMTYAHDKYRWDVFGFMDPDSKQMIKTLSDKQAPVKTLTKMMMSDITVDDIDKDGKDDLLIFGSDRRAVFVGLNGDFEAIATFQGPAKEFQRYAQAQGTSLLPVRDEIAIQYGGIWYSCDLKGKLIQSGGEKYGDIVYSDLVVASAAQQLIAAGELDGGNGIYFYPIKKSNWVAQKQELQGRMLDVKDNLDQLYDQVLNYKMPTYQAPSDQPWVMVTPFKEAPELKKLKAAKIDYVIQETWHESTGREDLVAEIGKIALKKDKRGKYVLSRETILERVKAFEAQGQPFTLWAGHGNDPFYLRIETMEAILAAAPNTCRGFVYAEMDNVEDPRVQHFVNVYVPRLAVAMRKEGRSKLYFRYKNMFWATTSHHGIWRKLFLSGDYNDILAPASEDTSSRTQEINLAGRIGLLMGGYVDNFAIRLVDDNPTSWRPLSPGGQRSVSPFLRQGVMMAAYGAHHGIIFDNKYSEAPGLNLFFAMMKSGVLPWVEKEDILSVGSWHLIQDVDEDLISKIDDHHNLKLYQPTDTDAVMSVGQMHWAGTSLPAYDFSKIALGVDYRWLNYVPELPHGMVPIAPIESAAQLQKQGTPYLVSTAKSGIVDDKLVPASAFASTIQEVVTAGDKRMPVLVSGAAWSAIRIDDTHTRLILMDQGYLDPQDRIAKLTFNGKKPVGALDILSGEKIALNTKEVTLTVPAGSLRFIDLTYGK